MDVLESMEGVVIVGATNRPDIIDPGLLRPGRFDRLILIPAPDRQSRFEIFKIHTKNMPLDTDVNLERLADSTESYSGADIESLCREAAMFAIRKNEKATKVKEKHFDEAMKTVRATITPNIIKFYDKISKDLGTGISKKEIENREIEVG